MKKKFFLLSLMLAAVFTASATVTWRIGTGETTNDGKHFTSLHAACLALKDSTTLHDDLVWLICSDLTESIHAGIVNNSEKSLTIRPDLDEARTISYYAMNADNVGPSADIVIGGIPETTQAQNIKWPGRATNNVTIDGCAEGYSTPRLTIMGSNGANGGGRTISLYGAVSNTVIKNCTITQPRNTKATYAIELRCEQPSGSSSTSDNTPTGTLIENCVLSVPNATNSQVVVFNGAKRSTTAGRIQNTTIKDCDITGNARCIFIDGANNVDIEGCTFHLPAASAGYLAHGILGNSQTGVINVKGCKFPELATTQVATGSYGIDGITATGGGTWNIENNIITGIDATNADGITVNLVGIQCGSSDCNIYHNTIVMPVLTKKPSTGQVASQAIACIWLSGSKSYVLKNNILISKETTAYNSLIRGALNANCKHNVFYHDGGNAAIVAGAAVYTDYASLPASAESKWKAVTFDSNMMLDGASITDNDLAVAQVAGITTDILGNTRNNPTYAGAEDPDQLTGFTHHLYEIGDNQGWDPVNSPELTMVEPNVFEGTFNFTADNSYFAFTTVQTDNWSEVHAHRYGGASANLVTDGSEQVLSYGDEYNLTIAPGTYKFRVDLNENPAKVYVEGYLYEIGNNIDWNLENHVAMTKVAANVYEKELTLTKDTTYLAFTRCSSTTDWGAVNAARYATGVYQERLDDGSEETLVKGDGDATVTLLPGVYTVRVDFNTNKVTVAQSVAKVNVTEAGYATYFKGTKAYTMPTGMTGYVFNVANRLEEVYAAGDVVPAATPLVLGAAEGTYDLVFTTGGVAPTANSLLVGSDEAVMTNTLVSGNHIYYGLSLNSAGEASSVGFYWMAENGGAFENAAHKAFLAVPVLTYQENFLAPAIRFEENNATDIQNVEGQEKAVKFIQNGQIYIQKNGVVYDAMGRVIR